MRKVLEVVYEYKVDITRRVIDKEELLTCIISTIISVLIWILYIMFMIFYPDTIITNIFLFLSFFAIFTLFLFGAGIVETIRNYEIIGNLNDNQLSFKMLEKNQLVEYTFEIEDVSDIKLIDNVTINIFIKDGKSYVLSNINNSLKIIRTFNEIKKQ